MSEDQKKQLQTQLWNIANELRGKMDADEFRDYILGFIFYKYLSEKLELYANDLLKSEDTKYIDVKDTDFDLIEEIKKASLDHLGYFLLPSELFRQMAERTELHDYIEDLQAILANIERSTMGTESEDDFDKLFSEIDLNANKLGKTVASRSELIAKVLKHLDKIDFQLENSEIDILGDAYEYLIAQFASGAGKKAGEFYTPQEVSQVLARIVTDGKKRIKSVYDPACGSGSLLLRIGKNVKIDRYYGQEKNNTTYNLARMNMLLHNVRFDRFDIKQDDTLEHPQHLDDRFEAIVANPPFSAKWSSNPIHLQDERFSQYGALPPKTYADFAFIQHMLYQLEENGIMATVMSLGVLFRDGAEATIRKFIVNDKNYLDAVIGLPSNLFYGTPVPACILVFKKCRTEPKNILFINSSSYFQKLPRQNKLREHDIEKIIETYRNRSEVEKYSRKVSIDEVVSNDYNLNITRYVDNFHEPEQVSIKDVSLKISKATEDLKSIELVLTKHCNSLGIQPPLGNNIDLLNKYKLGLMQRLFKRELRFSRDDGSEYSDWENKTIDDCYHNYKGSGISKDDLYTEGANPCILYGELYTSYPEIISEVISRTDYEGRVWSKANDLLIPSSTTTTGIDLANVTYLPNDDVLIGGDITILRPKEFIFSPYYAYYLTHFKKNEIAKYAQGSTIIHLYYKHFKNIVIDVPEKEEQIKIAHFLLTLDAKIMCLRGNLDQLELFKSLYINGQS